MSIVRGCEIPEQLFYKVEDYIWVRLERSGEVTLGYVAPGCVALGEVRSYSPRRVGKKVRARACPARP
jgi:glycine cleavage system H protein